eukprot:scaffold22785_cov72-Phaeocystis_antarctica.AAC.14
MTSNIVVPLSRSSLAVPFSINATVAAVACAWLCGATWNQMRNSEALPSCDSCRTGLTRLYPHRVGGIGRVDHPQVGNQVVERIVVEVRCHAAAMHGAEAVDSARAGVGVEHEGLIARVEVAVGRLGRTTDERAVLVNVELSEATMTSTAASERDKLFNAQLGQAARLAA